MGQHTFCFCIHFDACKSSVFQTSFPAGVFVLESLCHHSPEENFVRRPSNEYRRYSLHGPHCRGDVFVFSKQRRFRNRKQVRNQIRLGSECLTASLRRKIYLFHAWLSANPLLWFVGLNFRTGESVNRDVKYQYYCMGIIFSVNTE